MNIESGISKEKPGRSRAQPHVNRWAYALTAKADAHAKQLVPELTADSKSNAESYRALARALVAAGVPAPRGGIWSALAVKRLLERLHRKEVSENKTSPAGARSITRRQNYHEFSETVRPHLREALGEGVESLNGIARFLNRHQVRSHTGRLWSPSSVLYLRQMLKRAE